MKKKHKQFYHLKFESLYYNPTHIFHLTLTKKILIDETILSFIKENTILSSIFFKNSIENNIYQLTFSRTLSKQTKNLIKHRLKNKINKNLKSKLNLMNIKD